jgi:hypothetical protein
MKKIQHKKAKKYIKNWLPELPQEQKSFVFGAYVLNQRLESCKN